MKKLNKVLCLGAFAAASVMPLSGCNLFSQNLSEEQIDKLMYALDNADSFMDESLDLLEKSNEKLNNEEAYNLVRLARKYLYLNKDGVRDNLKVTIDRTEQGERSVGTVSIYTDLNNDIYVVLAAEDGKIVYYEDEGDIYSVQLLTTSTQSLNQNIGETQPTNGYKKKLEYSSMDELLVNEICPKITVPINDDFEIIGVTALESGGYRVTATVESHLETNINESIVEFVVTKDAKFEFIYNDSVSVVDGDYKRESFNNSFAYNEVDTTEIMRLVDTAKNVE